MVTEQEFKGAEHIEKKTIGSFICTLRKAKGMTQQNLADLLNVSNKSVSRWERDETAPDLTLIPVIAEIFEVTADELLKGERSPQSSKITTEQNQPSSKSEKQVSRILNGYLTKFRSLSYISYALTVLGFISTVVCAFGFELPFFGYWLGMGFYVFSVAIQLTFSTRAISTVYGNEFNGERLYHYRKNIINYTTFNIYINIAAAVFCLPNIVFLGGCFDYARVSTMLVNWASAPLLSPGTPDGWFYSLPVCAAIYASIITVLSVLTSIFIESKEELKYMERDNTGKRKHNTNIKIICGCMVLCAVILTWFGQSAFNKNDYSLFMKGVVFTEFVQLKEYMETVNLYPKESIGIARTQQEHDQTLKKLEEAGNQLYDNEIYSGTYFTVTGQDRYIITENQYNDYTNNTAFKEAGFYFLWRNKEVARIQLGNLQDDYYMPVTAYTYKELAQAERLYHVINAGFILLYIIEIAAGCIYYSRKRSK